VVNITIFSKEMNWISSTLDVFLFNYFFNVGLTHVYKYIKKA